MMWRLVNANMHTYLILSFSDRCGYCMHKQDNLTFAFPHIGESASILLGGMSEYLRFEYNFTRLLELNWVFR